MTGALNDVMHRKRARRILWIWEKSELSFSVRGRRLTFGARRDQTSSLRRGAARAGWGGIWKSQHRKIVYHSPYDEKPLNSKVIKSFVPDLRSRKCFSCFGIPMLSIYELWTIYVHFTYSCMATLQNETLIVMLQPSSSATVPLGLTVPRQNFKCKLLCL